jgi:hypothetical protein
MIVSFIKILIDLKRYLCLEIMDSYSGDIENLPLDKTYIPTQNERAIVDSLFGVQNKSVLNKIVNELKDLVLIAILFILFSLKNVDEFIQKVIPASQNSLYILLLIKTIAFVTIFWIFKNFYLSQSNN